MTPAIRAALICSGVAIGLSLIALAVPDRNQRREVFRIPLLGWRYGMSIMEEEVAERRYLIWYGAGLPKIEWRQVH